MDENLRKELIKITLFAIAKKINVLSGFEVLSYCIENSEGFEYVIIELRSIDQNKKSYNVFLLPNSGKIEVEEKIN